jgi:hypothetical protein
VSADPRSRAQRRRWTRHRLTRDKDARARDVSVNEGEVEVLETDVLPRERGDRLAGLTGFHPLRWPRVPLVPHLPAPCPGLARGEELPGRELMRDGRWPV